MLLLFAALAALLLLGRDCAAHDHWINQQRLTDPLTGQWCCNEHDCEMLAEDGVQITAQGYVLTDTGEVIPFARAINKSPDGRYWRCHTIEDGVKRTRCLIVPPPST